MSLPKDGGLDTTPPAVAALTPSQEPCPAGADVPREGSREIQKRGKVISVPHDWCKSTDSPVPYKIWCWQADAGNLANSVRQTDCRSHVQGSYVKVCYGDEPGKGGGIKSGTCQAECTLIGGSPTVRAEGRPMGRRFDKWHMNHGNTWGCLENPEDTGNYNAPKVQLIKPQLNPPEATREDDIQAAAQGAKVAQAVTIPEEESFRPAETPAERSEEWHREVAEPGDPLYRRPRAANDNDEETDPEREPEGDRPSLEAPEAKEKPDAGVRVTGNKGTVKCWNLSKFLSKKPQSQHTELITEYCKQLKEQEKAINKLTPNQFEEGRNFYQDNGRVNDQGAFKLNQTNQLTENLIEQGISRDSAAQQAAEIYGGQVGLHAPDQVVGGNYSQLLSMGLPSVNSSIGGGWPSRVADLDSYGKAAKMSGQKKMNVKLCAEVDGQQVC